MEHVIATLELESKQMAQQGIPSTKSSGVADPARSTPRASRSAQKSSTNGAH